ncbi:MAG TPA: hypothetical protein VHB77_09205 [Planctomycetaceae bacterium]|nr:hypothetical protein [Planctomycetaceae bacterium]
MRTWILGTALIAVLGVVGCGGGSKPAKSAAAKPSKAQSTDASEPAAPEASAEPPRRKFQPVQLGGSEATASADAGSGSSGGEARSMQDVVAAMQPLQVMLGKWRGTTNKKFNGFNAIDESEWIWDFRTDRAQPALTVTSDKSPYYRKGRLTYLPKDQAYQLTLALPDGEEKVFKGTWKEEPAEVPGDDNKPQRTYKLALDQVAPKDDDEPWQVVFSQQENNRYLLEINRHRPGTAVTRLDTVGTQRLGTSFALNDEDYGDKKCIISGGLGTIQVSYKGKSYWVCCTGCKAAFEEEPERWLAKLTKDGEMKK